MTRPEKVMAALGYTDEQIKRLLRPDQVFIIRMSATELEVSFHPPLPAIRILPPPKRETA